MPRLSPEEIKVRKQALEAQRRASEIKNKILASKLMAKSTNKNEEEKTIYLSPSQKVSGIDLIILTESPKFNKENGEKDSYNQNTYFVNMNEDNPFVFCKNEQSSDFELIKTMCGIANKEQLCVYGNFNGIPIIVEPNENNDTAYQRFEKIRNIFYDTYSSLSKQANETFNHEIDIFDYAKAKKQAGKFIKENPKFPFSEEMVAYGMVCAKNNNLKNYGKDIPVLIRLFGRDAKVTENVLKCLEVSKEEGFPLVFNKDKIKELSETRAVQVTQTNNLQRQKVRE